MRAIGIGIGQHHFAIAGKLDLSRSARSISDGENSHLSAIARHDDDVRSRLDVAVPSLKNDAVSGEGDAVCVGRGPGRLVSGRPNTTGRQILDVDPLTGIVARGIGAPTRYRYAVGTTVAAAGIGDQGAIWEIAEQANARLGRVRRVELANHRLFGRQTGRRHLRDIRLGRLRGVTARHALIEQESRSPAHWVSHETALPQAVALFNVQSIIERNEAHADVMRHRRADDRVHRVRVGARIVDRIVKAELAQRPFALEAREIRERLARVDREREHGCVGRDDDIIREPALERQVGYPKRTILIGIMAIAQVVRRFRDPPRHAARARVGNVPPHGRAVGLVEQRVRRRRHHQNGH